MSPLLFFFSSLLCERRCIDSHLGLWVVTISSVVSSQEVLSAFQLRFPSTVCRCLRDAAAIDAEGLGQTASFLRGLRWQRLALQGHDPLDCQSLN